MTFSLNMRPFKHGKKFEQYLNKLWGVIFF